MLGFDAGCRVNIFSQSVKNAIFDTLGSSITDSTGTTTSITCLEAHPLIYVLDNRVKVPNDGTAGMVFLNPIDFPSMDYNEFPERVVQTYTCDLYYIMYRRETDNPYEIARIRTEALAAKLDTTFRLGLTFADDTQMWWSRIQMLRSENDVATALRQLKQPYAVGMFRFQVLLDTDLAG